MRSRVDVNVRSVEASDSEAILDLLTASLGWVPNAQYADFFRWKHHQNPFGTSPSWVAVDGDRIVGLRVWLRWMFEDATGRHTAVRAVDTATHPDYQGRGIFRRLTTSSVEELAAAGLDFIFNTPNEQSKPGYLKMGWKEVGRLPTAVRFRSPISAARTIRARTPADKWSMPTDAGVAATELLADNEVAQQILDGRGAPDHRLRTALTPDVLRWRYGFGPLHYRAVHGPAGTGIFRLRRRGPATEAVVNLVSANSAADECTVLRDIARTSGADHVLQLTPLPRLSAGFVPLPGQGPTLTWRELRTSTMPTLDQWDLTMGDVELF